MADTGLNPELGPLGAVLARVCFAVAVAASAMILIAGIMDPGIVKGAVHGRQTARNHDTAGAQMPLDEAAIRSLPSEVQALTHALLQHPDVWNSIIAPSSGAKRTGQEQSAGEEPIPPGLAPVLRSLQSRRDVAVRLDWSKPPYNIPDALRGLILFDPARPDALLINGHKFCRTCRIWRPPRASHDTGLDVCVLQHDHFCSLVGNAVGKYNHPVFAAAAVCAAASTAMALLLMLSHAVAGAAGAVRSVGFVGVLVTPSWPVAMLAVVLFLCGRPLFVMATPALTLLAGALAVLFGAVLLALLMAARAAGLPIHRWMDQQTVQSTSSCRQCGDSNRSCSEGNISSASAGEQPNRSGAAAPHADPCMGDSLTPRRGARHDGMQRQPEHDVSPPQDTERCSHSHAGGHAEHGF